MAALNVGTTEELKMEYVSPLNWSKEEDDRKAAITYNPIMTGYCVTLKFNSMTVLIDTWDMLKALAVYSNAMQGAKAGEIVTLFRTEPNAMPAVMANHFA